MVNNRPSSFNSTQPTPREQANLQKLPADYQSVQSLPEIWPLAAQRFASIPALQDPHSVGAYSVSPSTLTYAQLGQQIQQFAAGLQVLGFQPEFDETGIPPRIALFADNSPRWLIADQGIMTAGAANVVRSAQAEQEELL
ncbi:MAG TPA: AMP-binding protein, partial [Cyanophyceae cyanobacterium]